MATLKTIELLEGDLVEFTRTLIRTPSLTGQEDKVALLIFAKLKEFGLDEIWIDKIGNVVGVLRGQGQGPNILLNGHMDVVPAGRLDDWRYDPFGAEIDPEGNIRGRGTADMKGGLAALVYTMKVIRDLQQKGVRLPGNLIFSAVVYEEAAEMFGMEYLCRNTLPAKKLDFDVCLFAEPTGGYVNLGHRGKVEIVVETRGKMAHSSQPWRGVNALQKMVPVLEHIFNQMSQNLPTHPELGRCSITVTNLICRPGALSIVPDECEISVDRRYLPSETVESILAEFETMFTEIKKSDPQFIAHARVRTFLEKSYTGYTKEVQKHHPVWIVDKNHPYVQTTCRALQRIGLPGKTGYFVGGVDGSLTAGLMGIPSIGFSGANEDLAHTYEENIPIKTLVSDLEAYASILCELFGLDFNVL
jgi:putative selenium metabolism hydrolase